MTLPASGLISLAQIIAEFGLAATAKFPSDFYGLGGAPAAGTLKFSDFYGRSGFVSFTQDYDGGAINPPAGATSFDYLVIGGGGGGYGVGNTAAGNGGGGGGASSGAGV